ncbi:MAG TPA: prepilin-type N-terminal cleavage/methylation domain-containing protein [Verrucomicrobiae bacterium]
MSEPEQKACPRCGERFECRHSAACWCADYPVIGHVEPESDCFCPKCLERECERRREGFTLVELLAVIAVIAILAAMLMPVLGRGQAAAKAAKCMSNLRQFCLSAQMYWEDNNGQTFAYGDILTNGGALYWFGWIGPGPEETRAFDPARAALYPYMGAGVDFCPSFDYGSSQFKLKAAVPTCDYGYNAALGSKGQNTVNMKTIRRPSSLALLADSAQVNTFETPASIQHPMFEEWYYIDQEAGEPNGQFRHDQDAIAVFCDGHTERETMSPGSMDQRLPNQRIAWLPAAILNPQN